MKETMKSTIAKVLFLCFFLVSIGLNKAELAEAKTYQITGYEINVTILEDGSADVEEQITYEFQGDFNGVYMDLDFSGTSSIQLKKILIRMQDQEVEARQSDSKEEGTYTYSVQGEIAHFKIYQPASDKTVTYVYQYRMNDVITKYNDIAEFNRKLVGTNWDIAVNDVSIHIALPEGASRDEIKVYAHGPLTGECHIIDGSNAEFTAPRIAPGDYFETRLLFPVELVPQAQKVVEITALKDIVSQETKWAQEANSLREKAKKDVERDKLLRLVGQVLTVILLLLGIRRMLRIRKRYGTDPKTEFQEKYFREPPGEYPPAELTQLFHNTSVSSAEMLATLLNLVRRQVLRLEARSVNQRMKLKNIKKTDYVFIRNPNNGSDSLKNHEIYLCNWLFDIIGDGQQVSLAEIRGFVKDKEAAQNFKDNFNQWKQLVVTDSKQNGFYPDRPKSGWAYGLLWGMIYLFAGLIHGSVTKYNMSAMVAVLGMIIFFLSLFQYQRTEYGSDQYKKWMAFKSFLKDFSKIEDATIPSIAVWEYYLVYAIPLGVAKEVIKQLPMVIEANDSNKIAMSAFAGKMLDSEDGLYDLNSMNEAFHQFGNAVSDSFKEAYSLTSSGSGEGGGASGGDSGGGGGDSGGGAF